MRFLCNFSAIGEYNSYPPRGGKIHFPYHKKEHQMLQIIIKCNIEQLIVNIFKTKDTNRFT